MAPHQEHDQLWMALERLILLDLVLPAFCYETIYCSKQLIKLAYRTNLNNAPIVVLIDAHDIYKIVNHHTLSCVSESEIITKFEKQTSSLTAL